jgi:DNA-binding transcriptional ArsR family regulator
MGTERCDLLCLDLPRAEELRRARLDLDRAQELAAQARAFADPTRLVLVDALARGGELCVCDLGWISGRSQNLVSHHLKTLRAVGLAGSRRNGKIVYYSLTAAGERLYEATANTPGALAATRA